MSQILNLTHNFKKNFLNINTENSEENFLKIFLQDNNYEIYKWIDLKHKDQSKLNTNMNIIKNMNSHTQLESHDFKTFLEIC